MRESAKQRIRSRIAKGTIGACSESTIRRSWRPRRGGAIVLSLAAPLAGLRRFQVTATKQAGPIERQAADDCSNGVGIEQHLNTQLPLNLAFTDDAGKQVALASYFGKTPAILALVYYQCPMLCSEELNGLTSALEMVRYVPGKDSTSSWSASIPPRARTWPRPRSAISEALWASGDGQRLAFPDRHAAEYRCADPGGGLRVREDPRAGQQADAVRARQLDPDCDPGGQAGAVLHGRGVLAQGYAAGPGRGFVESHRLAGRQHSYLLLPLRSRRPTRTP